LKIRQAKEKKKKRKKKAKFHELESLLCLLAIFPLLLFFFAFQKRFLELEVAFP
jgi:hypothetical protein